MSPSARRAERQKEVIADLGRRAAWGADVIVLIGEAMRLVRGILGTTNCVTTRRSASGEVRVVAADGDCHGFTVGPGERSRTDHTLQVAEPVLSDDLSRETRFSVPSIALENGMRRGLSVPVPERSGGGHVIIAHGPATLRPFTMNDARFVEAVAHVIGGALDRAATEDELRRRALEDPLTGLANRALLASQLDAELRHARRLGDRVCVLMLDVDRFKDINDTLGHSAGDTLLRKLAARLSRLRSGGRSGRAPRRGRVHRRLHPSGERSCDRRGRQATRGRSRQAVPDRRGRSVHDRQCRGRRQRTRQREP